MPKSSPNLPSATESVHARQTRPAVPTPPGPDTVPPGDGPRRATPGKFEIVRGEGGGFLLRLLDGDGIVLARSETYADIAEAVKGVEDLREAVATAHIADQTGVSPAPARSGR